MSPFGVLDIFMWTAHSTNRLYENIQQRAIVFVTDSAVYHRTAKVASGYEACSGSDYNGNIEADLGGWRKLQ